MVMPKEQIEKMFAVHATAVRVMNIHRNDYAEATISASVAKAFAYGEVLELSDEEVAAEMGLHFSEQFFADIKADRERLEEMAEYMASPAPE